MAAVASELPQAVGAAAHRAHGAAFAPRIGREDGQPLVVHAGVAAVQQHELQQLPQRVGLGQRPQALPEALAPAARAREGRRQDLKTLT